MTDSDVPIDHPRVRDLFYEQVRRGTSSDGLSVTSATPHIHRWTATGDLGWSEIGWSDLDNTNVDELINEQIEHFSSLNQRFVWRIYDGDLPEDLTTRLEMAGFTRLGTSELMIASAADTATDVQLPDGVSLVRANDALGVRQLIAVHEEVFATDQSQLGRTLLAQLSLAPTLNDLVLAVADGDGVPVSSARVQFAPDCDFAGFWGGSTLPQWRRKGLFKAMVAYRAQIAVERSYPYVYVIASSQSRPILEHLNFESFGSIATYGWQPAAPLR